MVNAADKNGSLSSYYFVGAGVASLAGAAYLIRDGNVAGKQIVILEESKEFGGALDAHGDSQLGYFMSGSRMFEHKYNCTFDLLSSIPSMTNAALSVTEETNLAETKARWYNRARLVDRDHHITDFHALGFDERDRIDLLAFMATPESALDSKRITDCLGEHFFTTNFWFEWCTLFAFQRWHSAIEFKRYLLRFIHHFATIDTQEGVYRTRFNQYDSIAVPLVRWLLARGVEIRFETTVDDLGFVTANSELAVNAIDCTVSSAPIRIAVAPRDCVFVTNGSMTAHKTFGSMSRPPTIERGNRSGAWRLWNTLAAGRPQFGDPATFDTHIEDSMWESFTVTVTDPEFFALVRDFSGSDAGKGGLITFKDSNWLITISIFEQPFFANQPDGVFVWWGYGLYHDKSGNYVRKKMCECTGQEILEEVLGHLGFTDHQDRIIAASNVIPCILPYITSQFLVRKKGDRPNVVPDGTTNLAFLGQYCELPRDVVFTVEYSIRSAQLAVYSLLQLDKKLTPYYEGLHDPSVLFEALTTLHR